MHPPPARHETARRPQDGAHPTDRDVVDALCRGDEDAFTALVDRYHASMVRVAGRFVRGPAVAEEVVQETWIALLRGIDRFGGRSSLKTRLFAILLNQARRRGAAEARTVPFSDLDDDEGGGPAVDPDRFFAPGHPHAGHWVGRQADWAASAEEALLGTEVAEVIRRSVAALPPGVAVVMTLRDLEGWSGSEVCEALDISEGNQRVRLHRARSRVRADLERYLAGVAP